ncbi:pyridoxamine 5'-phosphate oxidase family protein [Rhizobium sp. TH2]|uniref:pyridoxamine 5'-phosphate oxidase family protein n=1 Tax=Rhizobium sp. TH2 TaxID=2775403 RepID=UPI00215783B7|nr:pyridoxamine 5'-phosphate oxidase family protein [Rhizobium sp. TH2]UVC06681.1 pyridoxamine 5'-phosphate oxidase family protein [Rhizobium sp. TH2]
MTDMTLPDLARKIADIDISMLFTKSEGGELAGRPMSNNSDVEYDGDSYYFTCEDSRMVQDIKSEPKVALSLQGAKGLFGSPPIMVAIEGAAELIRDKATFEEHWQSELDSWFEQGPATPGLVLIKVHAKRIHYWEGEDEGEVTLN